MQFMGQHSKHSVSSRDAVAQALGYLTGRSKKGTRLSNSTHTVSGCFTQLQLEGASPSPYL